MSDITDKTKTKCSSAPFWVTLFMSLAFSVAGLGLSEGFNQLMEHVLGAPEESHKYYEITDCGSEEKSCVRFSGHMDKFSSNALMKIVTEQRAKEVQFNSGGGDITQIAVLRTFFDKNNILAVVKNGKYCVSACALLFSQLTHIAPDMDAEFGFHAETNDTKSAYYILNTSWRNNTWSERAIVSMEKDLGGFGKGPAGRNNLLRALQYNHILYCLDVKYIKWKNLVSVLNGSLQHDGDHLFRDWFEVGPHFSDGLQNLKRLSKDPEMPELSSP